MQDSLKEHIDNNREAFEVYPFDNVQEWEKLSRNIKPQAQKRNPWRIVGIAACFTMIIVGSAFVVNNQQTGSNEVTELENYYEGEINQKITLIKNQLEDDKILDDLKEMDAAFSELKADLNDNVDNEEVITAMMENYRLKLQILEEILNELEQEKSEEVR